MIYYTTFKVEGLAFAVPTEAVEEIVWLAELRPACSVPLYIIGILNYRGKVVPVMDLNIRMGQPPMRYQITDKVIIIGVQDAYYGLIVSEVQDVGTISEDDIDDIDSLSTTHVYLSDLATSFAKMQNEVIMLLHPKRLIQYEQGLKATQPMETLGQRDSNEVPFIANAPEHHRDLYRKRATNLLSIKKHDYVRQLLSLAMVSINDERFGFEITSCNSPCISLIIEFARVRDVRAIPCCPRHIVGSMNLHGNVLTLIDIRGVLNLAAATSYAEARVVVIQVEGVVAGIVIDDLIDVVYPRQGDIISIAAAEYSTAGRYFKGTIHYEDRLLPIVDLYRLLTGGELTVNEEA
ncbi:MAG: chemotaxis protein CheW [Nitrospirae bacterium]|nr:chemotaxis protein CheW [Nitrospirota bacterium]